MNLNITYATSVCSAGRGVLLVIAGADVIKCVRYPDLTQVFFRASLLSEANDNGGLPLLLSLSPPFTPGTLSSPSPSIPSRGSGLHLRVLRNVSCWDMLHQVPQLIPKFIVQICFEVVVPKQQVR